MTQLVLSGEVSSSDVSGVQIPSLATGLVVAKWAGLTAHTMLGLVPGGVFAPAAAVGGAGCLNAWPVLCWRILLGLSDGVGLGTAFLTGQIWPVVQFQVSLVLRVCGLSPVWQSAGKLRLEDFTQLGLVLSLSGIFAFRMKRQ